MEKHAEKIAGLLWDLDMLTPAGARLMADMVKGEPVSIDDMKEFSRDMSCTPSFFGGPEKIRPRHCHDLARSRFGDIPQGSTRNRLL